MSHNRLPEIVFFGFLGALLFAVQVAFAWLPNIELVSVLLLIYTRVYGWKALYPLYIFVLLEGIYYGFGTWFFNYLYVWLPLILITMAFRKQTSPVFWAIVNATFGLMFGALCALLYFFIGGVPSVLAYWISGIGFDLLHCGGNFITALALSKPMFRLLSKLSSQCN